MPQPTSSIRCPGSSPTSLMRLPVQESWARVSSSHISSAVGSPVCVRTPSVHMPRCMLSPMVRPYRPPKRSYHSPTSRADGSLMSNSSLPFGPPGGVVPPGRPDRSAPLPPLLPRNGRAVRPYGGAHGSTNGFMHRIAHMRQTCSVGHQDRLAKDQDLVSDVSPSCCPIKSTPSTSRNAGEVEEPAQSIWSAGAQPLNGVTFPGRQQWLAKAADIALCRTGASSGRAGEGG